MALAQIAFEVWTRHLRYDPAEPLWASLRPALQDLTDFAVDFRYPGNQATKQDAQTALRDCKAVRTEARGALGLPV